MYYNKKFINKYLNFKFISFNIILICTIFFIIFYFFKNKTKYFNTDYYIKIPKNIDSYLFIEDFEKQLFSTFVEEPEIYSILINKNKNEAKISLINLIENQSNNFNNICKNKNILQLKFGFQRLKSNQIIYLLEIISHDLKSANECINKVNNELVRLYSDYLKQQKNNFLNMLPKLEILNLRLSKNYELIKNEIIEELEKEKNLLAKKKIAELDKYIKKLEILFEENSNKIIFKQPVDFLNILMDVYNDHNYFYEMNQTLKSSLIDKLQNQRIYLTKLTRLKTFINSVLNEIDKSISNNLIDIYDFSKVTREENNISIIVLLILIGSVGASLLLSTILLKYKS